MEILEEFFLSNGFTRIVTNATNIGVFLNSQKDYNFLVILFFLLEGKEWNKEQCINVEEQILKAINSEAYDLERITLLVTKEPEAIRSIYVENDHMGVIDLKNNRLLIFEGIGNDSLGILKGLDQLLNREFLDQKSMHTGDRTLNEALDQTRIRTTDEGKSNYQNKIFQRIIDKITVIGKFSLSLVVINVLIFTILKVGDWYNDITELGSLFWYAVEQNQEYYRLFTSMFLHANMEHLLYNMLMLGVMGNALEITIGKLKFLLIYLISGVVAAIASMSYNMRKDLYIESIGASGAIYGIIGALLFIVLRNKGSVLNLGKQQIIIFVVMSLYGGFRGDNVDNIAHVGGLLAGIMLGIMLCRKPKKRGVVT